MASYIIPLSFTKPPLTANQRFGHWAQRAKLVKSIRDEVFIRARASNLPKGLDRIKVTLHYRPRDNRRRDADNIVPTMKAACDALAAGTAKHPGYGMVEDDTPDLMEKVMPIIHPAEKGIPGGVWLEIETSGGSEE